MIGGVANLVSNWKSSQGFWEKLTSFGVGFGVGAAVSLTAGVGILATAGVAEAGGALTGATNSVIAQTGTNFSGMNHVDWGQVGVNSAVSGVAGFAGGAAGSLAATSPLQVNGINISSPILKSLFVSPLSAAAGHVAGGTMMNLIAGQNLMEAFTNSFRGLGKSMLIGGALGVASTIGASLANGINPITGKPTDFFKGTSYSKKVLDQMHQDNFHGFPESVKSFQENGYIDHIKGGDGIVRPQLNIPGSYKGYDGEFIFMKELDGSINHRIFQPYK
ncbi:hypothetical protein Barb7_00026 [Bacteroidales bacterium Barb7]|nr:hypothetical protein Barb7_00077 [Bacteroidales bacterium Barb7]OAV76312.1 hypothetical protein Barb7_00026 [Bacteroidales bacterium Barb7]